MKKEDFHKGQTVWVYLVGNASRYCKTEEAIEMIESTKGLYKPSMVEEAFDMAISAIKEVQQYRAIGTVEECREAVEKQKPKKPHRNYKKFSGLWCKCGWYLGQKQCLDIKYCPNCGQAIDENLEGMEDE